MDSLYSLPIKLYVIQAHVPVLVLKARHICGSAFCLVGIGVPDKALGWFPLGFVGR